MLNEQLLLVDYFYLKGHHVVLEKKFQLRLSIFTTLGGNALSLNKPAVLRGK